jgi:hypothetical protein
MSLRLAYKCPLHYCKRIPDRLTRGSHVYECVAVFP